MQTVSAVPRARSDSHREIKSSSVNSQGGFPTCKSHSLENGMINHLRINYDLKAPSQPKKNQCTSENQPQSEIINHGYLNNENALNNSTQVECDGEKDKKKERKWSLGGFFKKKCKKDADDTSEDSEDDSKRGFLSRRRSKRERRKLKTRSTANGFDVIIPQVKEQVLSKSSGKEPEQTQNASPNFLEKTEPNNSNGPVRFIYRNSNAVYSNENCRPNKDLLQVPKQPRKDSSLFRGSGTSDNWEGRKSRKEVMARAEAKRDMIYHESSSDESGSYNSNSSLNKGSSDTSAFRRLRRLDRNAKRLSKDEEHFVQQHGSELRVTKSDFEGSRDLSSSGKRLPKGHYHKINDNEVDKLNLINHSRASSPSSTRARHKQLLHYIGSSSNSYPTSTFPPGVHHFQQSRRIPVNSSNPLNRNCLYTKEKEIHCSQPFISNKSQVSKANQSSEYIHKFPRSISATENPVNRKTLLDYNQILPSCGNTKEKSLSYEEDIHKASFFNRKMFECLPPVPTQKSFFDTVKAESQFENITSRKRTKLETHKNDLKRNGTNSLNGYQSCLKTFENQNEGAENRTDSTPSLSFQPGSFPQQPTQIVQRSASGNSFCNFYGSCTNFGPNRSCSYQHIPTYIKNQIYEPSLIHRSPSDIQKQDLSFAWSKSEKENKFCLPQARLNGTKSPAVFNGASAYKNVPSFTKNFSEELGGGHPGLGNSHRDENYPNLRYYADQNPRSRNPIHITCESACDLERSSVNDSQMVSKSLERTDCENAAKNASTFWKSKDREILLKNCQLQKAKESLLKPPKSQDRSRSNSPNSKNETKPLTNYKPDAIYANNQTERLNFKNKFSDVKNQETVKEFREFNAFEVDKTPPEPPVRRLSKQEVLERLHKCEELKNQESGNKNSNATKLLNGNLDDALNELEIIYNSLKLRDEDFAEKTEKRDLSKFCRDESFKECSSVSVRDKIQKFYAEGDFINGHSSKCQNSSDNITMSNECEKSGPSKKSEQPDKVCDDMAFRRLNAKDRLDVKKFPSPSYLRSTSALSPVLGGSPCSRKDARVVEPDVTYDDVVFRNIRHANSTLKIQDPQPPFGIPIGIITPAPNSDYLHATPIERFRPTFTNSKIPDVVKDDLAFRNLRKDKKRCNGVGGHLGTTDSQNLLKKRAVRSLSANIYNIMQKDNSTVPTDETENNGNEKTQSLTDLTRENASKQALEKRLKELKEEKNAKRAEFFEQSQQLKKRTMENGIEKLNRTKMANSNENFENASNLEKNIENVVVDGKKSASDVKKILEIDFPPEESMKFSEKKTARCPIVELSKYPAAAPSSTLQGNPFKEIPPNSYVDEEQLESLLSALAMEAKNTSKDLERELDRLEATNSSNEPTSPNDSSKGMIKSKTRIIGDFDENVNSNPSKNNKRRRNLSLSNMEESKEEFRKTGSLERRRVKKRNYLTKLDDCFSCNKTRFEGDFSDKKNYDCRSKTKQMASDNLCENSIQSPSGVTSTAESVRDTEIDINIHEIPPNDFDSSKKLSISNPSSNGERNRNSAIEFVADLSQILHDVEAEQHLNEKIFKKASASEGNISESKDAFQDVYEYNCRLRNSNRKKSQGKEEVEDDGTHSSSQKQEALFQARNSEALKVDGEEVELITDVEQEFEKLHEQVSSSRKSTKENQSVASDFALVDDLIADITSSVTQTKSDSYSSFPFPKAEARRTDEEVSERKSSSPSSSKGEGEVKTSSLKSDVWLACSYALAFAFYLQEVDFMTAVGIILAVVSILAILIL